MNPTAVKPGPPRWALRFAWGVLAVGAALALWAMAAGARQDADAARFAAQGWGPYGAVIVANRVAALWHAALMTLAAGAALWRMLATPRRREALAIAWVLTLIVAGDALYLSRHYVKTMPLAALDENEVLRLLKRDMPERRVALLSQDGFYNWWLTYLFPYHDIKTVNVTQMPRMPVDYERYLKAVGRNIVRHWQLGAVGYVLAPAQVWTQMRRDPAWGPAFEEVLAYNVVPADPRRIEAGFRVLPSTPAQPGQHVVLRLKLPAPRFALIAGWREAADEEALRSLAAPDWPLFEELLVAPESAAGLPPLEGRGPRGTVTLAAYRPGRMRLKTQSDAPALLRVSEKYDADWRAAVDGKPEPVRRVDFLFQGIYVPAGSHEVLLEYAPSRLGLWIQLGGLAGCGAAALALGWRQRRGGGGLPPRETPAAAGS
mgnify:CR=1 FL=1